jgi:hypothetical protein
MGGLPRAHFDNQEQQEKRSEASHTLDCSGCMWRRIDLKCKVGRR